MHHSTRFAGIIWEPHRPQDDLVDHLACHEMDGAMTAETSVPCRLLAPVPDRADRMTTLAISAELPALATGQIRV
jgi:hypothetical protein